MRPSRDVTGYDSAAAMAGSLACALHGEDFQDADAGHLESVAPRRARDVDLEAAARGIANRYPRRRYPAIAIGASNGALTHLFAALGIPWLPQTVLVPVRHGGAVHPDEPTESLACARDAAVALLDANPDAQLHHVHDPARDRPTLSRIASFRLKRRALGAVHRRFVEERLAPGGTLIVVDCGSCWPTTRVAPRYVFQLGALGGASPDEYRYGSARVGAYLKRHRSHRRRWFAPEPDAESPEAEWGFERSLLEPIRDAARRVGATVRRLVVPHPEDASSYVADVYRRWYRERGLPDDRLLVSSSVLMDPYRTLRAGVVPYWMVSDEESSAEALGAFLDRSTLEGQAVRELFLLLFDHGVDSVGRLPLELWRGLVARATDGGAILGLRERAPARTLGTFARCHAALRARLPLGDGPVPGGLELDRYLRLHEAVKDRHRVALAH